MLNRKQIQAAQLIADGDLTYQEIAKEVGVDNDTITNWKKKPEFLDRIDKIRADYAQAVRARGIAVREKRVEEANRRHRLLQQVIDERARDPLMVGVAGGRTGLMTRTVKEIGKGDSARVVEEFQVDCGLLNELRQIEKQVAQDLGQWSFKAEISGGVAVAHTFETAIAKVYGGATDEQIQQGETDSETDQEAE